jgi:hypothetical protein
MIKKLKNNMEEIMDEILSSKNTKQEILDAYNALFEKVKNKNENDPKFETKDVEEKTLFEFVDNISSDTVLEEISNLKINIAKNLDVVGEKLLNETLKLKQIQKAIDIENKHLDEVFQIKSNAYSLSTLILAQNEKKENFEKELESQKIELNNQFQEIKETFSREKKKMEIELEEFKNQINRQKDDYKYMFEITKKREFEEYNNKKILLEKELTEKLENFEKEIKERETNVSNKENEFLELSKKVELFPAQLDEALINKEKEIADKLDFKYKHEIELMKMNMDSDRKLYDQKIESMEEKIKAQIEQLETLSQQLKEANKRVENIAVKVVEGAPTRFGNRQSYDDIEKKDGKKEI